MDDITETSTQETYHNDHKTIVNLLIAKYLIKQNYNQTFKKFIDESESIDLLELLNNKMSEIDLNKNENENENEIEENKKTIVNEDLETLIYERLKYNEYNDEKKKKKKKKNGSDKTEPLGEKVNQDNIKEQKEKDSIKKILSKNYDMPNLHGSFHKIMLTKEEEDGEMTTTSIENALMSQLSTGTKRLSNLRIIKLVVCGPYLLCSTSSKHLAIFDIKENYQIVKIFQFNSIIKFISTKLIVQRHASDKSNSTTNYIYCCGIDGKFNLINCNTWEIVVANHGLSTSRAISHLEVYPVSSLNRCNDHSTIENHHINIVVCGMNKHVYISQLDMNSLELKNVEITQTPMLSGITNMRVFQRTQEEEINGIKTPFLKTYMALSLVDNTQLFVYEIPNSKETHKFTLVGKIALNNAQFSTHSFNISSFSIFNAQGNFENETEVEGDTAKQDWKILITTSHIPYMRVLVVDLDEKLFFNNLQITTTVPIYYDLVKVNFVTDIEQSNYSTSEIFYNHSYGNFTIVTQFCMYRVIGFKTFPISREIATAEGKNNENYSSINNNDIIQSRSDDELKTITSCSITSDSNGLIISGTSNQSSEPIIRLYH